MERKRFRNVGDVAAAGLWPEAVFSPEDGIIVLDPENSLRLKALEEVLCCIPEEDYKKLKAYSGKFLWHIPHGIYGQILTFPPTILGEAPYTNIIFLCPTLERCGWNRVLAVVAHEVGHILDLNTNPPEFNLGPKCLQEVLDLIQEKGIEHIVKKNTDKEIAVWKRICEWGFEREVKIHHAAQKRQETQNQRLIKKMKQE
jgi:hypothetical protein